MFRKYTYPSLLSTILTNINTSSHHMTFLACSLPLYLIVVTLLPGFFSVFMFLIVCTIRLFGFFLVATSAVYDFAFSFPVTFIYSMFMDIVCFISLQSAFLFM